ncbi:Hypothetical protein D9617_20g026750 [Elsinoe fawcettii]|nr:Hypothetical protein D9617_20g026750 [Elsinoe fawcettii]
MADFGQTWKNYSQSPMNLDIWNCGTDAVLGTVITSPAQQLKGGQGTESLTWSQSMSAIASGLTDGSIIWKTPSGKQFGVNIHVPLQIGPFGTAPYYQVWWDGCGSSDWQGSRTSEPFSFDKNYLGFAVDVSAQAGHSNLYLTITITDV